MNQFFFVTASLTCLAVIVESCTFLFLPSYLKYTDQNCMLRCTTFKSIFKNLILNILLIVMSYTKDHTNMFIRPFTDCKTVSSACCTEHLNFICHSSIYTQCLCSFFTGCRLCWLVTQKLFQISSEYLRSEHKAHSWCLMSTI